MMWQWLAGIGAGTLALLVARSVRGAAVVGGKLPASGASTATGRVYVQNGTLHGPVGSPTRLTEADKLWLARAIVGETGGRSREAAAAVTWALAQNMKLIARSTPFTSFTAIVRAYCQPVNPRWESLTSEGCQRSPAACTPAKLERRRQIRTMSWADIPTTTQQVVTDFVSGRLENPVPGMVDWHANTFPGAMVVIGGNHFGVGADRRLV